MAADPLTRARQRLGLAEQPEVAEVLAAIRRALDSRWLFEAEVLARFLLIQRPENPNAWALRGEAALADNDPASARVYFHEALRCLDELPAATDTRRQRFLYWRAIAEANRRLNRREAAEQALLQAARHDPDARLEAAPADAAALLNRAYPLILQNRLDEAEPLLKTLLQTHPANPYVWQGLAVLQHKRGQHEEALAAIDRALELKPDEAGLWNNKGVLLKPLGAPRLAERIAAYERAVALNPRFKEALSNLADALTSARRHDEAAAALEQALALDPDYEGAKINRINLWKAQGRKQEALREVDALLETRRHPEALNLKGALLLETGQAHKAAAVLEEARALDARNPSILNNLGNAYLATARAGKAIDCYRSAVLLAPGMAEAQANLSLALLTQIQHGAPRGEYLALAKNHLAIAQSLNPKLPQLFIAEGILKAQHENDRNAAQAAYEKALALQPESVQALSGLASLYADMGERKKARELLKRAYELAPDDTDIATSYIFALNYDPDSTPEEIHQAALNYGRHIQARVGEPYTDWPNARDPNKRLKVGFVSGDFRRHPTSYLTEGLFRHLPRDEVEVFAYYNHAASDDKTARIKAVVDHWRVTAEMETNSVCELIRADGIDILIDLSGHTGYHRLDALAKKPAPLQVTWLGFHSGTGLNTVDYYLIDDEMSQGLDPFYEEQLYNLPFAWNMDASLLPALPASPAPWRRNGFVTIGSLNNPMKYNEAVFEAWAEIMRRAPNTRLCLRYRQFADTSVKEQFTRRFASAGVEPERIELLAALPRDEALQWIGAEVDLALDPFPYGSHTTAIETLAAGVPIVAIQGSRVPSRVCSVFLRRLGLGNLVADDVASYIDLAVRLCQSPALIDALRADVHRQIRASPLLNSEQFSMMFARVLRQMWKQYCGDTGMRGQ